jgi:hypothetical protein
VVLTPAAQRGFGMVVKAIELARTHGWFLTRQFENEANPDFHSRTTAREIVEDFRGQRLDYWVTGYGTGGTLKGVGRVLAKEMPDTKIVVCEPEDAQLLASGAVQARNEDGSPAGPHPAFKPHPMQGWTPDFIPKITDDAVAMKLIHHLVPVPGAEAMRMSQELATKEGILGRDLCRRAAHRRAGPQGRQHPRHAPRHRRALPVDAAVRQRARRYDAGGAGDLALHPLRPVPRMNGWRPVPARLLILFPGTALIL